MRFIFTLVFSLFSLVSFAQTNFKLNNALIVGLFDKIEDQYTIEGTLGEMLTKMGIKTKLSLNALKSGAQREVLASDSLQNIMQQNGINTYVLVSVRGYDRTFKPASKIETLENELKAGHLFGLYRDGISSVTLEFNFYTNGNHVKYDMLKLGGVGSRETVIKKLNKKLPKKVYKDWK